MPKQITKHSNTYLGFRPKMEHEADWYAIRRWCDENDTTISAFLNVFIPFMKIAVQDTTEIHGGVLTVEFNFGRLSIPVIQKRKRNK